MLFPKRKKRSCFRPADFLYKEIEVYVLSGSRQMVTDIFNIMHHLRNYRSI